MEQTFRCDYQEESLDVRVDTQGQYFSQLDDIQDFFPGATRFRVDGRRIHFLQDRNGRQHFPPRIRHYPGKVIEVVLEDDGTVTPPAANPPNTAKSSGALTEGFLPSPSHNHADAPEPLPPQTLSPIETERTAQDPYILDTPKSNITTTTDSSEPSARIATEASLYNQDQNDTLLTKPVPSSTRLRTQSGNSTPYSAFLDAKSQRIEQFDIQLEDISRLVHDGQPLQREQQEDTQWTIQQTKDNLVIVRQKVDAILVQRHEPQESPIPRLFVILPVRESCEAKRSPLSSSSPDLLPQFTDTFRLFFLCECGKHSNPDSDEGDEHIDHTAHLTSHSGYEIDDPDAFIERYALYLLGMLQILKTYIEAKVILALSVGHQVQGGLFTNSVFSTTEITIQAIDFSIQFLEITLGFAKIGEKVGVSSLSNNDNYLTDLRALAGADISYLETLLKSKDEDEVMGNLHRFSTNGSPETWVCINHYRSSNRKVAMAKLLQIVELNRGQYDLELQKVTIELPSAMSSRDFFKQLELAPVVRKLNVQFNWHFRPMDLKQMVQTIKQSNIRCLSVNLNEADDFEFSEMTPGRTGVPLRYDSLLELLSSTRIESLYLAGVESLAYRCSDFAKGIVRTNVCSNLTSFEYACRIYSEDQTLLANILKACPRLTVLRLGSFNCDSTVLQELTDAIVKLQNLEALRLFRCSSEFRGAIKNFFCAFPRGRKFRELVLKSGWYDLVEVTEWIYFMSPWLERLVVDTQDFMGIDLEPLLDGSWAKKAGRIDAEPFKHLYHLVVDMEGDNPVSAKQLFPNLRLVQLSADCRGNAWKILNHVNYSSLRALQLKDVGDEDLHPLWCSFPVNGGSNQIETLSLFPREPLISAVQQLSKIALRHLCITGSNCSKEWLGSVFQCLNMSRLEKLVYSINSNDPTFRQLKGWPGSIPLQLKVHIFNSSKLDAVFPDEEQMLVHHADPEWAVCYDLFRL
ncbi:hypothetical protein BGZ59_005444 [Podila verticillata]|nr:hypothetical protein BGZ59_005444 [Podila verticillata]